MWEVFNMGCGFCVMLPEESADRGLSILARPPPGCRGDRPGDGGRGASSAVPPAGLAGGAAGLKQRG